MFYLKFFSWGRGPDDAILKVADDAKYVIATSQNIADTRAAL